MPFSPSFLRRWSLLLCLCLGQALFAGHVHADSEAPAETHCLQCLAIQALGSALPVAPVAVPPPAPAPLGVARRFAASRQAPAPRPSQRDPPAN
ncbi:hypothetical protein DFR40_2165 [Azonexus fungiphilus]|uniref:DUF2946 family protein n=1 Tax=Azonexus fungiphilus TaxID=146940 RepID=A0A495W8Y4_9RHOO|nr:hypothetical protein [Azonexus fungiphilus]RKT58221.1 hypothetical protein DFR40_2165 [Azonexus fungiphilus]